MAIVFAGISGYFALTSAAAVPWSQPVQLTTDNVGQFYALATSGNTLHMARGFGTVTYRRSTNEGATWSADKVLGSGRIYLDRPIVAEGSNVALVYFKNFRTVKDWCCVREIGDIYMRRSIDRGATWQPEVRLTTAHSGYRVALGLAGSTMHLTWMDYRSGDWDMYYRRSTDGGATWRPEVRLVRGTNNVGAERPDIVVRGNSVHLFWLDARDDQPACYRVPVCPEIYYKRSLDGGATWGSDKRLTFDAPWSGRPMAATSQTNTLIVSYEQQVVGDDTGNEVFALRSTDNGRTWRKPQRLVSSTGDSSHNFTAGNRTSAYVAWHDGRPGNSDIYFRESTGGGASWGPVERITNAPGDSIVPFVAVTSQYVHSIWGDDRSGSYQTWYSRRRLGTGISNLKTVPRVVGMTLQKARRTLVATGLRVGLIRYAGSRSVRRGVVISQEPPAAVSSKIQAGSRVSLVVSSGLA